MERKLILQCGECARIKSIGLDGSDQEINDRISDAVTDGWRYIKKWGEFICPDCARKGLDPLYLKGFGPPQIGDRASSRTALVDRVAIQLRAFGELDRRTGIRAASCARCEG